MPKDVTIASLSRKEAERLRPLALAGDEAAAARMIAGVSAFIVRTAKKYARRVPGSDVDDLTQAGLIAASQSIAGYDPSRGTAAWTSYAMTASARGIAREAFRAKQLSDRFPTADDGTEVDCETITDPASLWDFTDGGAIGTVRSALEELDPLDRSIIELAHGIHGERLDGLELAGRLGVRGRRMHQLLMRAQSRLRNLLERDGYGKASGKG